MSDYAFEFDGHDLNSLFVVSSVQRGLPPREPTLVDVPGRSGALFGGTRATPPTITVSLYAIGSTREQRQQAMRTLAGWLAVDEPKRLVLGDEGGRYRLAVPSADASMSQWIDADSVEVTFTCPDPWLYGEVMTETLPSGGTLAITVGGTAPTWPTITANATGGSQGSWIVTLEDGTGIYASIPSGTTHALTADCGARTLVVNEGVAMLPPSYDWPRLTPGAHTLTMAQGTGDATVTWVERWW